MDVSKILNQIVEKLTSKYNPEKIVLFGSYAWGSPTEDSDIDLFLILESNLRRDERAREISKLFSDRTYPLDIIVYTPKEIELSRERGNFFIDEILTKGKVLYEHKL